MTPEELFKRIAAALFDGGALTGRDLESFVQLDPADADAYLQAGRTVRLIRDGRHVPVNWEVAHQLASIAVKQQGLAHPARQFAAYLSCHGELHRLARETGLYTVRADEFGSHSEALSNAIDIVEARIPAAAVYEIWRGKIDSLTDRDAAARRFRSAYQESPDFVDMMMAEPGPHMYFSESELAERPALPLSGERERAALREQVKGRSAHFPPATLYLQLSMDIRFLRAFGPYWFGLVPDLLRQGFGMTFLVVGEEAETARVIEEAREMIRVAAAFRGLSQPSAAAESVIFVPTQVPEGIGQVTTYFACARVAHAEAALVETGAPLLILDGDIVLWEDLRPLLARVRGADLGCSSTAGLRSLRPWSRHMAGMLYLAPTAAGRKTANRVRGYIERGLSAERSWTLDQNALCYVLESPDDCRVAHFKLNEMMSAALQPEKRIIRAMREVF